MNARPSLSVASLSVSILFATVTLFAGSALAQNEPPPPAGAPPLAEPPPPPAVPMPVEVPPPPMPPPPPAIDVAPPPAVPRPPAAVPVKIDSPSTTIKFGFLAQPQLEGLGDVGRDKLAYNLFIRRVRILVGGTLFGVVDYFFDTDFPNLFKSANTGMAPMNTSVKATPGMNVQDAFVTYKPMGDLFKIDVGYMLPPMSHNSIQGSATLYGWDYFAYTFQHSNAFGSQNPPGPVGRDMGVELRGLVLGGHLEYRAGLFQGLRNAQTAAEQGSRNFFRVVGRVQINFLDAEPGFFYAGTYFGAKKILSIGGSYDFQDNYKFFAGDALVDLPLGPGVVTAQVNVAQWNGDTFIPGLVKQTAIVGEAGYNIAAIQVSPIFRYEHISGDAPLATVSRYAGGLAFWPYGHNSNLKAFYTRIMQDGAPHGANQFNLQWQVYFF
jgi:hypothetical protein